MKYIPYTFSSCRRWLEWLERHRCGQYRCIFANDDCKVTVTKRLYTTRNCASASSILVSAVKVSKAFSSRKRSPLQPSQLST